MDITFDFLIPNSHTAYTLFSGSKSLGLTIEGKNPNLGTIIVSTWDESSRSMKERLVSLPTGTSCDSNKIQIRSDEIPTNTILPLKITARNLEPDPHIYENNWDVLSGGIPFNLPGLNKDRYILIQGPLDSQNKSNPPKSPIESVMVHLEEGGRVVEPLVAGSNIFTHGKWFELLPNNQGSDGESKGKYFIFLDQ